MVFSDFKNEVNYKNEILAGLIIFLSLSYILGFNPHMLENAGMPLEATFFATALASAFACFISFFISKYPIGFTAGMGLNSIFTYNIVINLGISWKTALAATFLASIIFVIFSLTRLRKIIFEAIPNSLKLATCAGLGFFIAFSGLLSSNVMSVNGSFLSISSTCLPICLLILFGVVIIIFLLMKEVPAALFIGLLITAVIGLVLSYFFKDIALLPHIPETFISTSFDYSTMGAFLDGFGELFTLPIVTIITILITVLFVWFFDTLGLLISVATLTDSLDEEGNPEESNKFLLANGLGAIVGSMLSTSPIIPTVESIAGIELGGKTRITTLVVGLCFLGSIFFYPLILSIFTSAVTSPALIIVGIFMISSIADINFNSFEEIAPVFMTIAMIFFTYSIATGIIFGFLTYVIIVFAQGKIREVNKLVLVLTIIFVFFLFFGI